MTFSLSSVNKILPVFPESNSKSCEQPTGIYSLCVSKNRNVQPSSDAFSIGSVERGDKFPKHPRAEPKGSYLRPRCLCGAFQPSCNKQRNAENGGLWAILGQVRASHNTQFSALIFVTFIIPNTVDYPPIMR